MSTLKLGAVAHGALSICPATLGYSRCFSLLYRLKPMFQRLVPPGGPRLAAFGKTVHYDMENLNFLLYEALGVKLNDSLLSYGLDRLSCLLLLQYYLD